MNLLAALLLAARILPLVAFAPFFGAGFPTSVRLALGFALAVALWPLVGPAPQGLLALLLVKEVAVGASIGFLVSLIFHAAAAAGRIADTAAGVVGLATVYRLLAVLLFFATGGHRLFLAALLHSYEAIPAAGFPAMAGLRPLGDLAVRLSADLLAVALGLAAPVLAATLLADLGVGLVARFAPELSGLGLPFRAVAALGVLAAGLLILARAISVRVAGVGPATEQMLRLLHR
jgi:flagellar biosynthesis protein FliR